MKLFLLSILLTAIGSLSLKGQSDENIFTKLSEQDVLTLLETKGITTNEHTSLLLVVESYGKPVWLVNTSFNFFQTKLVLDANTAELEKVTTVKYLKCGTFASEEDRRRTLERLAQEGAKFSKFIEREWANKGSIDLAKYK